MVMDALVVVVLLWLWLWGGVVVMVMSRLFQKMQARLIFVFSLFPSLSRMVIPLHQEASFRMTMTNWVEA